MKLLHLKLIILIIIVIVTWLALGVYEDREFDYLCLFVKHRPSSRFYFYTSIHESDRTLSSLTLSQQKAELAYQDFIESNRANIRSICFFP